MKPRKLSPEGRAKIIATVILTNRARLGKPLSPGAYAKVAAANRSPERRAAVSAASLGKLISAEHRAKISAANTGNRHVQDASIKGECAYCGDPATGYDHVVPLSRGGADTPDNIVVCCLFCNDSKNSLTIDEWLEAGLHRDRRVRGKRCQAA